MRKLALLLIACCMCVVQVWAQTKTVTGRVTDSKGSAIGNVSVTTKGTTKGTTTGSDGTFSITIPSTTSTLTISSVGYQGQDVSIAGKNTIQIELSTINQALDEVVVTAYGSTQKKSFTGTASTINNSRFKDLQVSSITNVLQGNASGVIAVNSSGQPGTNPTIRIRGVGSVNGSSDPIIILDGAPYGGNINSINPNDIESITVLKDASSTALYGSRAANGILNIVTKTGRGEPKVAISVVNGWSNRAVKDYQYASSQQIYELTWEALRNQAQITPTLLTSSNSATAEDYASKTLVGILKYNPYRVAQPVGTDGKLKSGLPELWNENWTDALIRTGMRKDYNASISGGGDRTRYLFSGGFLDDEGLPIESRYKRYTGRFKVDTKINNWLNAGINTNTVYSTQNYPTQGGSAYSNVIGWIRGASSLFPVYLRDTATGNYILDANGNKQFDYGNNGQVKPRPYAGTGSNPVGTTAQNPVSYNRFTSSANGFAEAQIIKGLKVRSQYVIDYYQYNSNVYYNPFVGDGAAYGGRSNKTKENVSTQTFTNTVTYDKTFGIHHINALGGMESYKYHDEVLTAESRGFTFPGVTELAYGTTPYTATSYSYDNRMVSYFGRLNYDLTDRYHLSASLRTDATSRFPDSTRWGSFYSVGAAWNLNKESFLRDLTVLNDLKLRASYGTTGNQNFSAGNGNLYFPYLGTYTTGANIAGYSGTYINSLQNGNLKWEKQKTLDLGIDFAILKNRVTGSATYFKRESSDLLFGRPLPPSVGISNISDNIGKLQNRGIELDLTTTNISTKNFEWTTSINFSHIKNKILSLPQGDVAGANFSNLSVGQPLYNFYIREYAGVDPNDGRPLWYIDKKDASGNVTKDTTHTYSLATRYYKGTSLPDWTGGITNTVRYKNFDLFVLASFNIGGKIYDADYAGLMYGTVGTTPGQNWSVDILNRWQSKTNPGDGQTPRLTTTTDYQSTSASTRWLFDASYLRVRNITLGYSIPKSVLSKAKLTNARIYADWQNPFTIFNRVNKGLDPEAGIAGVTSNTSVVYKTISVGLNVNF